MKPNAAVNVSVSSHYRDATYASEQTSQGILGEPVEILERGELFSRISQTDNYQSWVSTDQLTEDVTNGYHGDTSRVATIHATRHFFQIRTEPSHQAPCLKDGVIGCRLVTTGEENDWYQILLPDGLVGWAEKDHFGSFPNGTAANILALASQFLGYQYTWGGRTPKGFDCSGLVQTVFGLLGIPLPRDSWQQQERYLISKDFRDAEAGDLLFFGKTPDRVTHVAISRGNLRFIHASGWVRENSFRETDKDFSREHVQKFISVNRYPLHEGTS